jgi:hypothetical protein
MQYYLFELDIIILESILITKWESIIIILDTIILSIQARYKNIRKYTNN